MSAMAPQVTGVSIVCSNVCSGADRRKHQNSASLASVRGIHWYLGQKGPVTRKMFPFDEVIMPLAHCGLIFLSLHGFIKLKHNCVRHLLVACSTPNHQLNGLWIRPLGTKVGKKWIKLWNFHWRKCVCKCRVQNCAHFVATWWPSFTYYLLYSHQYIYFTNDEFHAEVLFIEVMLK